MTPLSRLSRATLALASLSILALSIGCASPPAPVVQDPTESRFVRDVYRCLYETRNPISDAITSGKANPRRYNACMQARGWERDATPAVGASG